MQETQKAAKEGDRGLTHTQQVRLGAPFHKRFPPQLPKHGNEIKCTSNKEHRADYNLIF